MTPPISIPKNIVDLWQQAVLNHSPRCRNFKTALELHRANLLLIWQIYTQQRRELGRLPFTDARLVGPYLLGFHLPNVARFLGLLQRSLNRGLALPQGPGPIRVIDLGAGTGAGSQAVFLALRSQAEEKDFEFELVDRSRHLVQAAQQMLEELAPKAKAQSLSKALDDPQTNHLMQRWQSRPARLNILCLGYVWNELSSNPRLRGHLLETLHSWAQLETPTWLLLTEPAAEASARGALRLREILIDMDWQILYPCLKTDRCPMGSDGRDWCYSEFEFKKPELQLEIEKILKVSRATLGSAAYTMINLSAVKACGPRPKDQLTVVGRPPSQLLLCDGSELQKQNSAAQLSKGELIKKK
ncbi:MAG: small ribosomal subunit Rsm22 family protein [Bdellovibrionales bacterium]